MVKKKIMIASEGGLHLRPSGQLCQKAQEFPCKIQMIVRNKTYNLKSVLSVLSAQVTGYQEAELVCEGEMEEEALKAMEGLLTGEL